MTEVFLENRATVEDRGAAKEEAKCRFSVADATETKASVSGGPRKSCDAWRVRFDKLI